MSSFLKYRLAQKGNQVDFKEYDAAVNALWRNKKYMIELFNSYNSANVPISFELAKSIINKILVG